MPEKITEAPGWSSCIECGSEAFPITYCPECDGGTVYVPEDFFDRPEIAALIIATLSDGLAERLEARREKAEPETMPLEEAAAKGLLGDGPDWEAVSFECMNCGGSIPPGDASCPNCGLQIPSQKNEEIACPKCGRMFGLIKPGRIATCAGCGHAFDPDDPNGTLRR